MYLTAEYCRQPTAWSITHQISCSLLYLLCCKTKLDNVTSNTAEEEVVEHWPPRPRTVSWPRKRPHANKRLPRIQRCIRTQTLSKGSSRKIINTPRHVLLSGKILSHFQSCFFVHVMLCSGGLLLNSFARRMETALESTHIHRRSQQAREGFHNRRSHGDTSFRNFFGMTNIIYWKSYDIIGKYGFWGSSVSNRDYIIIKMNLLTNIAVKIKSSNEIITCWRIEETCVNFTLTGFLRGRY